MNSAASWSLHAILTLGVWLENSAILMAPRVVLRVTLLGFCTKESDVMELAAGADVEDDEDPRKKFMILSMIADS
jgi:hypothetical protein